MIKGAGGNTREVAMIERDEDEDHDGNGDRKYGLFSKMFSPENMKSFLKWGNIMENKGILDIKKC